MHPHNAESRPTPCPTALTAPTTALPPSAPPPSLILPARSKARKVVEDVAREAVIAAKISGVAPSMHVFLTPNTDGDEATLTSANIVAGRSFLHKVDAVLIPRSMLRFLEITSDKKFAGKGKKKNGTKINGTSLTVSEALKNSKGAPPTGSRLGGAGMGAGGVGADGQPAEGRRRRHSTSGAAEILFTAAIGLPSLLLATLLVL